MKLPTIFTTVAAIGISFSASQAAVLIGPSDFSVGTGKGGITSLGTVTTAQLAGATQLVIQYTVTRATPITAGDSWLTLVANGSAAVIADPLQPATNYATTGNLGALLRTVDVSGNTHQLFNAGNTNNSAAAAAFGAVGSSVRITIDVANGFTGTSAVSFAIDEAPSGAFVADKTTSGTMTWSTPGSAAFSALSQGFSHQITGFTVTTIPEAGTSLFALVSISGAFLQRRRR